LLDQHTTSAPEIWDKGIRGMNTQFTDFPINLVVDLEHRPLTDQMQDALFALAEKELHKLAKGNNDIISVRISIKSPSDKPNVPTYAATIAAEVRPSNIAATETANDPTEALRAALRSFERQVRSKREKLRGR
jgi:ribosome-associated translation inhibitor RaiA